MRKKEKIVYKEKINWKRELSLLPGYLIVSVWVLFTAVFLVWILAASLSTSREIFSGSVFKFETGLHFENYVTAWKTQNVSVFFGNSLLYSVVSCFFVLLISAPAAYVLSRFVFKGSKQVRGSLILAMSIPEVMIVLPIFSLTTQWGIKGRILLMLLYIFLRVPYTTTYLLNFFATLSKTYEEAAASGKDVLGDHASAGTARDHYRDDLQFPERMERVLHGADLCKLRGNDAGRRRAFADRKLDEIYGELRRSVRCGCHRIFADLPAVSVPVGKDHCGRYGRRHQGMIFYAA